jgi:hypothetical protein
VSPVNRPPLLMDTAKQCRAVWERASSELGNDLGGFSVLDLMADNITGCSLIDLQSAIWCAGIYAEASPRIRSQIAAYR